jgi:hypothetical protein
MDDRRSMSNNQKQMMFNVGGIFGINRGLNDATTISSTINPQGFQIASIPSYLKT